MKALLALPLLAALSAASDARAGDLWARIDFRLSTDGGATWTTELDALPGATVRVGLFTESNAWQFANANIRWSANGLADGDAVAFAAGTDQGCTANIGHVFDNAIFRTPGVARFDRATDLTGTDDRVNTHFGSIELDVLEPTYEQNVFAFEIAIDALAGPRDIELRFDSFGLGPINFWVPDLGLGRPVGIGPTFTNNVIRVVPAPASLGLLAAAGLAARRRRPTA